MVSIDDRFLKIPVGNDSPIHNMTGIGSLVQERGARAGRGSVPLLPGDSITQCGDTIRSKSDETETLS